MRKKCTIIEVKKIVERLKLYIVQVYLNTTKLVEIFIECDDFIKGIHDFLDAQSLPNPSDKSRKRARKMSESEMMTIVIYYHFSGFKCFKWYYNFVIRKLFKSYFPTAFSYTRFIQLMAELNLYLAFFMTACRIASPTKGNYIDSKKLVVSHNRRIKNHKVHKKFAKRGKSSTGWFYGFKLHLVINRLGEIVLFKLTAGNVADNNHALLESIAEKLQAFLFGDRGYISKIAASLKMKGLHLITKLRSNMKQKQELSPEQKYYMKHRGLIESVFDILKSVLDLEHSRNRSTKNYFVNVLAAIVAYTFLERKPSIPAYVQKMSKEQFENAQFLLN